MEITRSKIQVIFSEIQVTNLKYNLRFLKRNLR